MKKTFIFIIIGMCLLSGGCSLGVRNQGNNKVTNADFYAVHTHGYHDNINFPVMAAIHSEKELEEYYKLFNNDESIRQLKKETFKKADDKMFSQYTIFILAFQEGSGSEMKKIEAMEIKKDNTIHMTVAAYSPQIGTNDMAEYHLAAVVSNDKLGKVKTSDISYDIKKYKSQAEFDKAGVQK